MDGTKSLIRHALLMTGQELAHLFVSIRAQHQ